MLRAASNRVRLAGSRIDLTHTRRRLPSQRGVSNFTRSCQPARRGISSASNPWTRARFWLERRRLYVLASGLSRKWWIRRPLRAGRYVVLGGLLFASMKEIGSIEYANDPARKERELLEAVVASAGGVWYTCDEGSAPLDRTRRVEDRVRPVVARCVEGARELARRDLERAKASGVRDDVEEAQAAVDRMRRPWRAVVVCTSDQGKPLINAWVTALCPRTVFVTEALVEQLDPTPDELALCIGHELGHLLCGHTEGRLHLRAALAYAELVFLPFLDPTGLLTLMGAMGFQRSAELYLAKHSRTNEEEADAVSLTIAALACYAVTRGASFMRKLGEATGSRPTSWWATHPATEDRYADLTRLAVGVHRDVYAPRCNTVRHRFNAVVLGRR